MKSRTENGAGSDGASPLIVVRLLDRLPLLYQILDLTAEISLRLGQRVLRITSSGWKNASLGRSPSAYLRSLIDYPRR